MKPHQLPISQDDRANQLGSLARDAKTDPEARRKLADAALIFGLVNSNRVDLILISAIDRFRLASEEALRELTHGIDRENRRRAKNNKTEILPEDHRQPEDSSLPEVALEHQPCPSCGHAAADKTFRLGKDSRKPVAGSPDSRFTYATCNGCGLKVRIVFYSGV